VTDKSGAAETKETNAAPAENSACSHDGAVKTQPPESPAEQVRLLRKKLDNVDSMARMGFDAAALVHDLSNLIGGMMGHVQLAQMTGEQEDWLRCSNIVGSGMNRARELIADFKTSVNRNRSFQLINLRDEINRVVEIMGPELDREGIRWKVLAADHYLLSDPGMLRKALLIGLTGVAVNLPKGSEVGISAAEISDELVLNIAAYPSGGMGGEILEDAFTDGRAPIRLSDGELQYLDTLIQEIGGRVVGNWEEPSRLNCRIILPIF
jgi:hypothetical protein